MHRHFRIPIVCMLASSLVPWSCTAAEAAEVIQAAPAPPVPQPPRSGAPAAAPAETPVTGRLPRLRPQSNRLRPRPRRLRPPAAAAIPEPSPLKDVFFNYDKSDIRDDQKAPLNDT